MKCKDCIYHTEIDTINPKIGKVKRGVCCESPVKVVRSKNLPACSRFKGKKK